MASYMYKVLGTPTGTTKNTISVWFKRSKLTSSQGLVFANGNAGGLTLNSDDKLQSYNAGGALKPNRLFRDTSAWYHVVLTTDTTLGTADDRLKMYINGVQETSFATRTNPSVNATSNLGTATEHIIGANNDPANYYDGLMSHVQMVDGLALAPTEFGQYDANGVWTIKTSSYGTLGNNGFHITFDNPADIGASTNSNNFTPNANLKPTQDNPSNVFASLNPLGSAAVTFSKGNLEITQSGSSWLTGIGSIGASSGKFYGECKVIAQPSGSNDIFIGFLNLDKSNLQNTTQHMGEDAYSAAIFSNGGEIYYNSGSQFYSGGGSYSTNAIIQLAMDLDNGFLYWGKDGTWQNSADPTSGATGTGGMAISNLSANGTYTFGAAIVSSAVVSFNLGNGYFGTTAVSSAGTNASGNGIFEHDCPTGYTALSTKGLNL